MSGRTPGLGAVVLAARGGPRLADAVEAVAWADARAVLVLDPALVLGPLPSDVVVVGASEALARLPVDHVLLLRESERVEPTDVTALRAAAAGAGADGVVALPVATRVLDIEVTPRARLVRIAPPCIPLALRAGLQVEFARTGHAVHRASVPVRHEYGATLDDVVEQLGYEGDVLGVLLETSGAGGGGLVWHPLVALTRTLLGRAADRRLGLGRWIAAVVAGYGVVVAYAKRWEQRRDRTMAWEVAAR